MVDRGNKKKVDIYEKYRCILNMRGLTNKEIDVMRKHLGLLAQTTCEHVWKRKLY
ncbi:MAG: hypothetical protein ACYSTS_13840 [Planctomycetota bacterium]|jgi:hypothetical protein